MAERRRDRAFVDASVFLRYFTQDDEVKADRCRTLFERAEAGEVDLQVSQVLLAEVAWTLRSPFAMSRAAAAERLGDLVNMRGMRIPDRPIALDAIDLYVRHNVSFVDAHHAAEMKARGLRAIYSYDRDFDKLGVRRLEP
jgi:predicted nucleic acid-binding protein